MDDGDLKSNGLHGTDCRFTTGTRTLDTNFDFLETVAHGLTAGILSDHLGGISCALS